MTTTGLSLVRRTILIALGIIGAVYLYMAAPDSLPGVHRVGGERGHVMQVQGGALPPDLLDLGIYNLSTDLSNERGVRPPFWSNATRHKDHSWGPCYAPRESRINWKEEIRQAANGTNVIYPKYDFGSNRNPQDVAGRCRPSFLIIGAGKCGTR